MGFEKPKFPNQHDKVHPKVRNINPFQGAVFWILGTKLKYSAEGQRATLLAG